jgi:hypothetical protein
LKKIETLTTREEATRIDGDRKKRWIEGWIV